MKPSIEGGLYSLSRSVHYLEDSIGELTDEIKKDRVEIPIIEYNELIYQDSFLRNIQKYLTTKMYAARTVDHREDFKTHVNKGIHSVLDYEYKIHPYISVEGHVKYVVDFHKKEFEIYNINEKRQPVPYVPDIPNLRPTSNGSIKISSELYHDLIKSKEDLSKYLQACEHINKIAYQLLKPGRDHSHPNLWLKEKFRESQSYGLNIGVNFMYQGLVWDYCESPFKTTIS